MDLSLGIESKFKKIKSSAKSLGKILHEHRNNVKIWSIVDKILIIIYNKRGRSFMQEVHGMVFTVRAREALETYGIPLCDVEDLLTNRRFVPLGKEMSRGYEHRLLYIFYLERLIVAVVNKEENTVMTFEPYIGYGGGSYEVVTAKSLATTERPLGLEAYKEVVSGDGEREVLSLEVLIRISHHLPLAVRHVEYPLRHIADIEKLGEDDGVKTAVLRGARELLRRGALIAGVMVKVGESSDSCVFDFDWI